MVNLQLDWLKSKSFFLKNLKQGQVVKCSKRFGDEVYLFEFGHFNEDTGELFWQTAIYEKSKDAWVNALSNPSIIETATVAHNGKIFEQKLWEKGTGSFGLASSKEIQEFDEAYDIYITKEFCEERISKQEVYMRPLSSGMISRIQLAVKPPEYMCVHSINNEKIFKSAPLTMLSNDQFSINYKEMIMVNDEVSISEPGRVLGAWNYNNETTIREASDTERKLLVLEARKKKEHLEKDNQILPKNKLKELKQETMLYAVDRGEIKIFYFHSINSFCGKERIDALYGYALITDKSEFFINFVISGNVCSYDDDLTVLRKATEEEIQLYEKIKKRYEEERRTEIEKKREYNSKFKPFVSKVLVCNGSGDIWIPATFGCVIENTDKPYVVVGGGRYSKCVFYNKNKELLGKVCRG